MNTKLFFLLITVFAFFVFSCNSAYEKIESTDEAGTYSATAEELYYLGYPELPEKPYPGEPGYGDDYEPPVYIYYPVSELIITVDDIMSFNITNGDIVFTLLH